MGDYDPFVVGPVGCEPTTSGPDLLGGTSAPGSPSITGHWYPLGGVNPLDQARRRPPTLGIESTGILPFRRLGDHGLIASGAPPYFHTNLTGTRVILLE